MKELRFRKGGAHSPLQCPACKGGLDHVEGTFGSGYAICPWCDNVLKFAMCRLQALGTITMSASLDGLTAHERRVSRELVD